MGASTLKAGIDPLGWVISKNLNRRHLTDDQRRMVAARVATMKRGGNPESNSANGEIDRATAAKMLSVDVAGVDRAKVVVTHGAHELQDAVDQRRVTVRMAADLAALSHEQQREIIALSDPRALKEVVKMLRQARQNHRAAMALRLPPRKSAVSISMKRPPKRCMIGPVAVERFGAARIGKCDQWGYLLPNNG